MNDLSTGIHNFEGRRKLLKVKNALEPMMSRGAIEYIAQQLQPTDVVLEWGSGGSTTVFSQLVKKYISIEHKEEWYKEIKKHCSFIDSLETHYVGATCEQTEPDLAVPRCEYNTIFCKATHGRATISESTYHKIKKEHPYAHEGPVYSSILRYWQFQDYVNKIYDLGVDKFDKIIIDGRSRTFCAYIAHNFMHKDSVLFIDDVLCPHPAYGIQDPDGSFRQASRLEIEFGNSLENFYTETLAVDGTLALKLKRD